MKGRILMAVLVGLAFAPIAGATGNGSIVGSFKSPAGTGIGGLTLLYGHLYHAGGPSRNTIFVTTTTGQRLRSFPVAYEVAAVDITRDVTSVWTCSAAGRVFRLNPSTGSIRASFYAAPPGRGIAYGGGLLWYASGDRIYRYVITGSLLSSFRAPGRDFGGLDYHDGYIWAVDRATWRIYQFTEGGSIVSTLQRPPGMYGVTRGAGYFWYTNITTGYVYQATAGYTSVAPASLGAVKALYR